MTIIHCGSMSTGKDSVATAILMLETQTHESLRFAFRNVVEWSKTKRGGQNMDWIRITEEPAACASAYGLCE